jgi:sulfide:quinone oxidoreductase
VDPLEVLVVGGGVGALELVLGLHKLAEERVHCTLVAPEHEFRYRPASVAVPFEQGQVLAFSLPELAGSAGARFLQDHVAMVDTAAGSVRTVGGEQLGYDVLVVASGARRVPTVKGAITFGGEDDIPAIDELLDELASGQVRSLVFALPAGASWAVPLYELALLTAAHLARHDIGGVSLTLVTPEERPLAQFDRSTSELVTGLLERGGVELVTGSHAVGVYGRRLMLVPAQTLEADRVVAVPAARGVQIEGLPHDFEGFLTTDLFGRVAGLEGVFAIGDVTSQPVKQGGIAAQQADVVAQLLAHQSGAPVDPPQPHRPLLRGLLLTGDEPRYLASDPTGGHATADAISTEPLWWPGGKIAARHLGAYLVRAGSAG